MYYYYSAIYDFELSEQYKYEQMKWITSSVLVENHLDDTNQFQCIPLI